MNPLKTFKEIKSLNWSEYSIEDMHDFKFETEKLTEKVIYIFNKPIKTDITSFKVNTLYELAKLEPKKEFVVLSDCVNSARGYYWTKEMVEEGFDDDGKPIYEYFLKIFNNRIQDFMRYSRDIFMPCF
jgi:hypothetical protein